MRFLPWAVATVLFAASPALAVTVSNCDQLPREVTINSGGEIHTQTIPVSRSIQTYGAMISLKVGDGPFVSVRGKDVYCIRNNTLSLQMRRPLSDANR